MRGKNRRNGDNARDVLTDKDGVFREKEAMADDGFANGEFSRSKISE